MKRELVICLILLIGMFFINGVFAENFEISSEKIVAEKVELASATSYRVDGEDLERNIFAWSHFIEAGEEGNEAGFGRGIFVNRLNLEDFDTLPAEIEISPTGSDPKITSGLKKAFLLWYYGGDGYVDVLDINSLTLLDNPAKIPKTSDDPLLAIHMDIDSAVFIDGTEFSLVAWRAYKSNEGSYGNFLFDDGTWLYPSPIKYNSGKSYTIQVATDSEGKGIVAYWGNPNMEGLRFPSGFLANVFIEDSLQLQDPVRLDADANYADIRSDGIGGGTIVWGSDSGVKVQILKADGSLGLRAGGVSFGKGAFPAIDNIDKDNWIIVWQGNLRTGRFSEDYLLVNILSSDGSLLFESPIKVADIGYHPSIVYNGVSNGKHHATIFFLKKDTNSMQKNRDNNLYAIALRWPVEEIKFIRGDADRNNKVELTDAIIVLDWLFKDGEEPKCLDAADADDNRQIQLTDAVRILNFLFKGGESPAQPYPEKGVDSTQDELSCKG